MSTFQCPICGSTQHRDFRRFSSTYPLLPEGITRPHTVEVELRQCAGCGLEFTQKFLENHEFDALYEKDEIYSTSGYIYEGKIAPKYTFDTAGYLHALFQKPGAMLEIGFLSPDLLLAFREQGWQVYGLDLDAAAVAKAAAAGFAAHAGKLDAAAFPGTNFDLIVASAVLEHVEQPVAFIQAIRDRLNPGGHVMLQLPNASSLNAFVSRLSPHNWDMYAEPGHVFHYRRRHLVRLLEENGLEVRHYATSTIRIRGKVPFLPGRFPRLERRVKALIHRSPAFLAVYTAFLRLLDTLKLGDTHVIVAARR